MAFEFSVPREDGDLEVSVEPGSSVIFVGANGGGKTRLAVRIEETIGLNAHRISAHRALDLNPRVAKISEAEAKSGLATGNQRENASAGHRISHRWGNKAAIRLLSDYDFVVQALFAEQSNTALKSHEQLHAGNMESPQFTKFQILTRIWDSLLPHRKLVISGDDIRVSAEGVEGEYTASEMSDGERAVFYLIGQALLVDEGSLLIVDEPELHIHRAILDKLWDELEAARPDSAFVFITHDLEFAASRDGQKFVIRKFDPTPLWTLEEVPEDSGFSEETATLILGSRKPVLFVEGDVRSIDLAIYRCCYPDFTVIPKGSCEQVIHSVVTMRNNQSFTRVTCSGIVDADDYSEEDRNTLNDLGVRVLPVSEIENLFALPDVSSQIAFLDGYSDEEVVQKNEDLLNAILATIDTPEKIEAVVVRYCRRRIDRTLKKIDLSAARSVAALVQEYGTQTAALDVTAFAASATARIQESIQERDLGALLACYDNKGILAIVAQHMRGTPTKSFLGWLTRMLRSDQGKELLRVMQENLPEIEAV